MPDVFLYRCDQPGAPVLGPTDGSLTALLYACLVTGFGLSNVVSITRVGNVATASFATAHTFAVGDPILIAGADQAAYNGKALATAATGNTLSWVVTGEPATPATGSMTIGIAPVGWDSPYSSGAVRVFRSADVQSSQRYFRIDDSLSDSTYRWAETRLYESMTDINTGVLRATVLGYKSAYNAPTPNWVIAASARTVYVFASIYDAARYPAYMNSLFPNFAFGDLNSIVPGDVYQAFVVGSRNVVSNLIPVDGGATRTGAFVCRARSGMGGAVPVVAGSSNTAYAAWSAGDPVPLSFPRLVFEDAGIVRGTVPGVGESHASYGPNVDANPLPCGAIEFFDGVQILGTPRRVMFVSHTLYGFKRGSVIDITGPWH